jgi:hypothetical protein
LDEASTALETLSRSDAGAPWRTAIARELERIAAARRAPSAAPEAATLPLSKNPEENPEDSARSATAHDKAA